MKQNGQAIIVLIFFMAIIVIIVSASVTLMISSASGQNAFSMGSQARLIAESGIENAILRLLRNPDYSGETITVGEGQTQITVSGNEDEKTIVSQASYNNYKKTVEARIQIQNNVLDVISWKQI